MNKELREIIVKHTSEMLDNPGECEIYPTTKFYNNLQQAITKLFLNSLPEKEGSIKYPEGSPGYELMLLNEGFNQAINQITERWR